MKRTILTIMFLATGLHAGKGIIPLTSLTRGISPVERAIILFNGKEEIMVLSNDVQATQPTKAWELIPFRRQVVVEKGSLNWLRFADTLLRELSREKCPDPTLEDLLIRNITRFDNKLLEPQKAFIWKSRVGHTGFIKWLEDTLQSGYCVDEIPPEVEEAIDHYASRGFRYWVMDIVDMDMEIGTVMPILFRFKSNKLYYPIGMSKSSPGAKTIMLYIVSKDKIGVLKAPDYHKLGPFKVKARDLSSLYPDIVNFFGVKPDEPLYFMGLIYNGQATELTYQLPVLR